MTSRFAISKRTLLALLLLPFAICHLPSFAQQPSTPWSPDLGSTYKNPILFADYSDPDVVRVADDFYLTSSSFNHVPGLPILHSRDLVNWTIVNHALPRLVPEDRFAAVHHGEGVWAPSIRFHDGKFWIFYPDPDFGIYVITAADPAGKWSAPVLVKAGKGLIDPSPLWDDDGTLYLVHAWARSRSGKNNILTLVRLSPDATRALDEGRVIIDGNQLFGMRTLEGPKFYKRNGWYYIFAPTGGVTEGVQSVFRARRIDGPYDHRIVLAQGSTPVNGPHQGALVDTPSGQWWFLHFQDKGPWGRIVHLQPVTWRDDWPLIGEHPDFEGKSEPVLTHAKPGVSTSSPVAVPQTSDEFTGPALGLQWQWQANPDPAWARLAAGSLHLAPVPAPADTLYAAPNLLLQKFTGPAFVATTSLTLPAGPGTEAGLMVFGDDYAWVGLRLAADGAWLVQVVNQGASKNGTERIADAIRTKRSTVQLRVTVTPDAVCRFSYSYDGTTFTPIGEDFTAKPSRWVGAKVGLFAASIPAAGSAKPAGKRASAPKPAARTASADFPWFRVTAP